MLASLMLLRMNEVLIRLDLKSVVLPNCLKYMTEVIALCDI